MSAPFVLAAGGTGGHLFPAEALAAELVAHRRQVRLLTDSRVEGFAADLPGIEVTHLKVARIEKGLVRTAQGLAALSAAALQSRRLLRRLRARWRSSDLAAIHPCRQCSLQSRSGCRR